MMIVVVIAVVQLAYHQKIPMMHVKFVMFVVELEVEVRMHKAIELIVSNPVLTVHLAWALYLMDD